MCDPLQQEAVSRQRPALAGGEGRRASAATKGLKKKRVDEAWASSSTRWSSLAEGPATERLLDHRRPLLKPRFLDAAATGKWAATGLTAPPLSGYLAAGGASGEICAQGGSRQGCHASAAGASSSGFTRAGAQRRFFTSGRPAAPALREAGSSAGSWRDCAAPGADRQQSSWPRARLQAAAAAARAVAPLSGLPSHA